MAKLLTATQDFYDDRGHSWKTGDTDIIEDLDDYWLGVVDAGFVTVSDVSAALNDADEKVVTDNVSVTLPGGAGVSTEVKQDVVITNQEAIIEKLGGDKNRTIEEIDEPSETLKYIAYAPRGSATSAAVWTIEKWTRVGNAWSMRLAVAAIWDNRNTTVVYS